MKKKNEKNEKMHWFQHFSISHNYAFSNCCAFHTQHNTNVLSRWGNSICSGCRTYHTFSISHYAFSRWCAFDMQYSTNLLSGGEMHSAAADSTKYKANPTVKII